MKKFLTFLRPLCCRFALLGALTFASIGGAAESRPHLHLVSDSTMSDQLVTPPFPERGWGQMLSIYVRDPDMVMKHAQNGRSTKSFIAEGKWARVIAALEPSDWVIVQVGHNDEKETSAERYADPHVAYPNNLRRMVSDLRAAGAIPILATPIVRRRFGAGGQLIDTRGEYPHRYGKSHPRSTCRCSNSMI